MDCDTILRSEDKFREQEPQGSVFSGLQIITFISNINLTPVSKTSLFYMYMYTLMKQHFKTNQRALKFKLYYNLVTKAMSYILFIDSYYDIFYSNELSQPYKK